MLRCLLMMIAVVGATSARADSLPDNVAVVSANSYHCVSDCIGPDATQYLASEVFGGPSNAAGTLGSATTNAATVEDSGGSVVASASVGDATHYIDMATGDNATGIVYADATSYIFQDFEIIGPSNAITSIPVTISSSLSVEANNHSGITYANALIFTADQEYFRYLSASANGIIGHLGAADQMVDCPTFGQVCRYTYSDDAVFLSNTLYQLWIVADVQIGNDGDDGLGGQVQASVDPMITIDPAYAPQFGVYGGLLGPPIPTISSTPEPATWALLLSGFGLVGMAVRRRRLGAAEPS